MQAPSAVDYDNLSKMPHWQQMQYKSFRAWANYNINAEQETITALSTAFKDGLTLVKLLEQLSGEKIKGVNQNPKMRIHNINNLGACFQFLRAIPIVLENIAPEDITDGNIKLILGLLWVVILHYQIQGAKKDDEADAEEAAAAAEEGEDDSSDSSDDEDDDKEKGGDGNAFSAGLDAIDALSGKAPLPATLPKMPSMNKSLGSTPVGSPASTPTAPAVSPRTAAGAGSTVGAGAGSTVGSAPPPVSPRNPASPRSTAGAGSTAGGAPSTNVPSPKASGVKGSRRAAPGVDPKSHLLQTIREHCADCKPDLKREITNFSSDWQDGYSLLQLLHCKDPDSVDLAAAKSRSPYENAAMAIKMFQEDYAVPPLLDPQDLTSNKPDEKAVMTYVSIAMEHMDKNKGKKGAEMKKSRKGRKGKGKKGKGKARKGSKPKSTGAHIVPRDFDEGPAPVLDGKKVPLTVRVAGARDIENPKDDHKPSTYAVVSIPTKQTKKLHKTSVIPNSRDPEWNEEFCLDDEDLTDGDTLRFFVFNQESGGKDTPLGVADIPVHKLKSGPQDIWLPVRSPTAVGDKDNDEGGEIHIVVAPGMKAKLPPVTGEPLDLRICSARNLAADKVNRCDPYVVLEVDGQRRRPRKTKQRKATVHPVWNKKFHMHRGEVGEKDTLRLAVYDWKRIGKDDKLGTVAIPVKDFIASPEYDEWLPLGKGDGMIHIQGAWGKARLPPKPTGVPLVVRVAKGRHLKPADRSGYSDPYCQVSVVGHKPQKGNKTKAIKGSLNPEWNEEFLFDGQAGPEDALRFDIYDQDRVSLRPRPLGYCILPLSEVETTPVIDTWIPLNDVDKKKEGQGDLHVQLAYGDSELPPVAEGIPLTVRVGAARDIKAADKSGTSDPYVSIKLHGKRLNPKMKTKVVKRTVNPEWNEEFSFERGEVDVDADTARFIVYDHDRITRNEPLGLVDVPLKTLKAKPMTDVWLPLLSPDGKGKGEGEIHLAFAYGDDVSLPPVGQGLNVRVAEGRGLKGGADGSADPYAVLEIVGPSKPRKNPFRTKVVKGNTNPAWYDEFNYNSGEVNPETDALKLTLYDYDKNAPHGPIGQVIIPLKELRQKPVLDLNVPVMDSKDPAKKGQGEVRVQLAYGDNDLPPVALSKPVRVRIVGASALKAPADTYAEVKIAGKKADKRLKTKTQKKTVDPDWNAEFEFKAGELDPSRDVLRFPVKDSKEVGKDVVLGEAEWPLMPLLTKPSQDLFLTLKPGKKSKLKGDEPQGTIHVQIAYGDAELPKAGDRLALQVVAARNLKAVDRGGYSDPYVVVQRPNNPFRRKKTEIKKNTVHPVWNAQFDFPEGFINRNKDVLSFEIYDWDRVGKDDPLGYVEIPVRDFGINSIFDRWLPVMDYKAHTKKGDGELHIQAVYGDLPLWFTAGKGCRFRVAEARGLLAADKSVDSTANPYAVIEVQGKKLRKMKTKTVEKSLDPIWNDEFSLPGAKVVIPQDLLQIRVYDYNRLTRKTPLGYCDFPLKSLTFDKPIINEWLPLYKDQSKKDKVKGEVHLVAALEGFQLPPASREFAIVVKEARNLLSTDKSGTCDPYIRVKVPGKRSQKKQLKTRVVKKSASPVWNQTFIFDTQYFDEDDKFNFQVRDKRTLGKADPIGVAKLKVAELFGEPFVDTWVKVKPSDKGEPATGDVRIIYATGPDGMKKLAALLEKEKGLPPRVLPPKTNLRRKNVDDSDSESDSESDDSDEEYNATRDFEEEAAGPGKKVALNVRVAGVRDLSAEGTESEPVAVLTVPGKKLKKEYKTTPATNGENPEWNAEFDLRGEDITENDTVKVTFSDKSGEIGSTEIPVKNLIKNRDVEDHWLPVNTKKARAEDEDQPELHLTTVNGNAKLPPVKGEPLEIRICGARNLAATDRGGFSDPYVEFKIKEVKRRPRKTKIRKATLHPVWNKKTYFMRGEVTEKNTLEFMIYDWNRVGKDDKLGRVEIPVADFVASPEYDEWVPIVGGTGHLHIQAAWGSATLPPKPTGLPMVVRIAKARHLKAANKNGYSDPYCQMSIAGKKAKRGHKTTAIKNTLNPEWNEEFLFEGDVFPVDALRFEIHDSPSVLSPLAKGKSLGSVNLPLAELEAASNIDVWLALRDAGSRRKDKGQGEIHIQIAYGEDARLPPIPQGLPLTLRVASARDLPAADRTGSSDPYVVVKLKTKKLRRKMKTKVIDQNLNPEWNEEFSFERGEVDIDADILQFHIFDQNRIARASPLALCEFPLKNLKAKPVQDVWLSSNSGEGDLHVLLAWGDATLPPLGHPFAVRVAEGKDLKGVGQGGSADPYGVIEVVSPTVKAPKRPARTKVVKQNIKNPVWYDEFNFPRGQVNPETDVLKVTLFDHNHGGTPNPMGQVLVPLKPLLKTPILDGLFPVMDHNDKNKKGQGEVRLTLAFGDADLPAVAAGKPVVVRVVSAKDVEGTNNPYVHIKIGGKSGKNMRTPIQRNTYNPEWNTTFNYKPGELDAKTDTLRFVLKGAGEVKDTTIGVAEFPLLPLIAAPSQDVWLPVVAKGKKGEIPTQIRVQFGYGNVELPKVGEKLSLRVVAGRDLKGADRSGYADPYVIINRVGRPFPRRLRTDTKKATVHPTWNEEFYFEEGSVNPEKEVLSFEVFNWDRIGKDQAIGYVEIPMKDVGMNSLFDKWVPLMDGKSRDRKGSGELRIQAIYGDVSLPATSSGQGIRVRVGEGRGLLGVDKSGSSDPYCVVKVKGKKLRKMQTKVVKKSLSPVWNAEFNLPGDKIEPDRDVVVVECFDWDRLGKTTPLGFVEFPLRDLKDNPVLEKWLPLQSEKGNAKVTGELKLAFALEGHSLPAAFDTFTLVVAEAKDLPVDKGSSDTYCVVTVPGKTTASPLKTPSGKDARNPVWNQELVFDTKNFDETDSLRFDVYDWESGGNQSIGFAEVNASDLFSQPFIDAWLPLFNERGEQTTGQVHILYATSGQNGEERLQDYLRQHEDVPGPLLPPTTDLKVAKKKKLKKSKEPKPKDSPRAERDIKKSDTTSPRQPTLPPREDVHTKIKVRIAEARNLKVADRSGTSDPYVLVEVPGRRMKRRIFTRTVKKTLNPLWDEDFDLSNENIDPERDLLQFVVYDWVRVGDNVPMCRVQIPVRELIAQPLFDQWLPLGEYDNPGKKTQGELHIITAYDYMELPKASNIRKEQGVTLNVRICEAKDLPEELNPYVTIEVPRKKKEKRIKTGPTRKTSEPVWDEDFNLSKEGVLPTDVLRFNVFHHNHDIIGSPLTKDVHLGTVNIPVSEIGNEPTDKWYKLAELEDAKRKAQGELRLIVTRGSLPDMENRSTGQSRWKRRVEPPGIPGRGKKEKKKDKKKDKKK